MSARIHLTPPDRATSRRRLDEDHGPPVIKLGRAAVLLLSAAAFVAMFLGYLMGSIPRPQHIPTDPGTPTTVTTIGGPR
ncbi:MAG TPA: hypothetical protein VGX25_03890 [Actinophytocola sp.]|uniref:hypothetical protein n=1 Tax=Actinophytocola sp. TaxID=1872138 RepID=UPI002DDD3BFC|nr:hypothetical protein [Actinophytocola sp.]HEV2778519.1 hypothetical protein [Actinophytocola sp.]